jgi:hypothetical protein
MLTPIRNIYDKFVAACEANCTPGTGCTVDESLHGFRGMCSFKQDIPNKPSKSRFWLIANLLLGFFQNLHESWHSCTGIPSPNPASWRKQMQFNTHLIMQTISLCCPLLQRKTRGSYFCPICIPKKGRLRYWKRRNKCVLQPGKRWCRQS